ncbi:hypothetical protein VUR80DRAFT_9836 [Thermomyces stellatus]
MRGARVDHVTSLFLRLRPCPFPTTLSGGDEGVSRRLPRSYPGLLLTAWKRRRGKKRREMQTDVISALEPCSFGCFGASLRQGQAPKKGSADHGQLRRPGKQPRRDPAPAEVFCAAPATRSPPSRTLWDSMGATFSRSGWSVRGQVWVTPPLLPAYSARSTAVHPANDLVIVCHFLFLPFT